MHTLKNSGACSSRAEQAVYNCPTHVQLVAGREWRRVDWSGNQAPAPGSYPGGRGFKSRLCYQSGCSSVCVECLPWKQEVVGSNPATQTKMTHHHAVSMGGDIVLTAKPGVAACEAVLCVKENRRLLVRRPSKLHRERPW